MKNLTFLLVLALLPLAGRAQEELLFKNPSRIGGFGAPIFEYSTLKGTVGRGGGGGGAVIVDDFFFGGYGTGASFYKIDDLTDPYNRVDFGHGGFWLGYTPLGGKVVHPYTSFRIGWGGIDLSHEGDEFEVDLEEADQIFVLTPEAGVEINLFRWFRLAGTVGYRWVNGVELEEHGLDENDFNAFTGSLVLRFGGFGYGKKNENSD